MPIEKYGKTPIFSGKQHFYSYFQNPSENSAMFNYFVLPSENQNAFARSADFEFELILYSRIETARHLVGSDFLQRSIRRRVPRVKKKKKKKTDEIQKEHTHLTLSLSN